MYVLLYLKGHLSLTCTIRRCRLGDVSSCCFHFLRSSYLEVFGIFKLTPARIDNSIGVRLHLFVLAVKCAINGFLMYSLHDSVDLLNNSSLKTSTLSISNGFA
jgi:hypothetical protein